MKYTDRKKTPLKWHRFLTFVGLPLTVIAASYSLIGLISELFGLRISHTSILLKPVLNAYGATVANLGGTFWYVVAYFIVQVLLWILLVVSWLGLLQWNDNARRGWIYYLLITMIQSGLAGFMGFTMYRKSADTFSKLITELISYNTGRTASFGNGIILAGLMLGFIVSFIYFLLNAVYYSKRKALFVDTYLQPENAGMVNRAAAAYGLITADSVVTPEPVKEEPVKEEPIQEVPAVEEPVSSEPEPAVADSIQTEPAVPVEPEKAAEEDTAVISTVEPEEQKEIIRFCPNCGAKLTENDSLFCTHCGTKLK